MNTEKIANLIRTQTDDELIAGCNKARLASWIRTESDERLLDFYSDEAKTKAKSQTKAPVTKTRAPRTTTPDEAIAKVFAAVAVEPTYASAISNMSGIDIKTVSKALARLEKAGKVGTVGKFKSKRYFTVTAHTNGAVHGSVEA